MRSRVRMTARWYRLLAWVALAGSVLAGVAAGLALDDPVSGCTIDCAMTMHAAAPRVLVAVVVAAPGILVAFVLAIVAAAGDGPLTVARPERRSRWLGTVGRRELGSGAVRRG